MRGGRSDGAGTRVRAAARAAAGEAAAAATDGAARAVLDPAEGDAMALAPRGACRAAAPGATEGDARARGARHTAFPALDTAEPAADGSAIRGADRAAGATRATPLDAATRACFLDQLAMLGCPARAAAAVGVALVSAYALRRRSVRFAAAWRDALAIGYERLEAAALRQLIERETPLDLAAALALLDRHRAAAAGAAPVAPPRAPRGQRHPLGPAGAELARRLKLYAGVTPGVRRAPVSPAAAAEVDSFERAAAADWDEREEAATAPAHRDAAAADSDAGAGTAAQGGPDAPVDTHTTDMGTGSDVPAAPAADNVSATAAETALAPDSCCSAAPAGAQEPRAPHVAILPDPWFTPPRALNGRVAAAPSPCLPAHAGSQGQADHRRAMSSPPGLPRAREHGQTIAGFSPPPGQDSSADRRVHGHEGPPRAGWPSLADPCVTAIGSAADERWPGRSSAPEAPVRRSAVDAPVGALGLAAPPRAAPPVAVGHAVPATAPAAFDGARRSACQVDAPPPVVGTAPRPRVWA